MQHVALHQDLHYFQNLTQDSSRETLYTLSHTSSHLYLANTWNSASDGFSQVSDPNALARAACLYPLPDTATYFLIVSCIEYRKSFKHTVLPKELANGNGEMSLRSITIRT